MALQIRVGCFGSHLYLTIILLQVEKRLLEKGKGDEPIPSITTLRYQFNPSYLKRKTASKYKGCFDVVCKIQRRQIRKFHQDARYFFEIGTLVAGTYFKVLISHSLSIENLTIFV